MLAQWIIGDLKAFRLYYNRYLYKYNGALPGKEIENKDYSSTFTAFKYIDIPNFLMAKKLCISA